MSVIGIQVHYCEDGQHKQMWLDLNDMQAISWTTGDVGEKPGGSGGNAPIPEGTQPGPCPQAANGGDPFCWWNGSQWICGEL